MSFSYALRICVQKPGAPQGIPLREEHKYYSTFTQFLHNLLHVLKHPSFILNINFSEYLFWASPAQNK